MIRIISSLLFVAFVLNVQGQDMPVYHKYERGNLKIRWKPDQASDWLNSLYTGYILEKYEEGVLVFRSESPILTQTFDYLRLHSDSLGVPRHMVASLNHMEEVPDSLVNETFPSADYTQDQLEEARFEVLNYLLNSDFRLTRFAGLGYLDVEVKPNVNYRYVIRRANAPRTNSSNSAEFTFNSASYQEGPLPTLAAEWADRQVKLLWPTAAYKQHYFGFQLSKGIGNGDMQLMDTVPIMNLYDTSSLEIFQKIEVKDLLDNNDSIYTYRLKGYDYFGGQSSLDKEVKGKGRTSIGLSPMIYETNQLPTNEVEIKWELLDKFKDEVQSYNLYISESWEGPYILDTAGLDPTLRELIRPIPYGGTYFRIAALDFDRIEHSSFPQLVMSLDTIAPAIPVDLDYTIDTNGIINIQWTLNTEEDFLGYKVFLANDSTDEFSLSHYDFLSNAVYLDTINLISINEYIYYKIISIDRRNNRSEFSKILTVEKPDILPPVEPNFLQVVPGAGLCLLKWDNSISEDVVSQSLYRRIMDVEKVWTQIAEWSGDSIPNEYMDTSLSEDFTYVYIMTAMDDAGLESEPSEPIAVQVYPDHNDVEIDNFTVTKLSNNGGAEVKILFDLSDVFQVWIYKQKNDEKERILKKIEPPLNGFIDKRISEEEQNQYFIQVIFEDGVKSVYSNRKTVN